MLAIGLFALVAHAVLVTRNWTSGFMPGHEFRQTQTALISRYIDRDGDFSLLYETPLLGKPWVSLLLEAPFCEWAAVGLHRLTGCSLVVAGRTVSLASFYLALPALYLLLARLRLDPRQRGYVLALVLCCPVYIFYSRAFLIDATAFMFSAWFLVAYLEMMDRRRWTWFLAASIAGALAALIKNAIFAVWLLPAAAGSARWLWRELRSGPRWIGVAETAFWGLAGVTIPLGLLEGWIALTDPIKAAHPSAWIFTSRNLSTGNWGLTDWMSRLHPQTWAVLMQRWSEAILPAAVIVVVVVAALVFLRGWRGRILGLVGCFLGAQLLFPYAYAYQDYYFYACAVFLVAGLGVAALGVAAGPAPAWCRGLVVLALPAALLANYARTYLPQQWVRSDGGFAFTRAIRDYTPENSVIVVTGADWAAIVPYYTDRRALMIRNGLESDPAYLERAIDDLAGENVSALVAMWSQRRNEALNQRIVAAFGLEKAPTFTASNADVYVRKDNGRRMREGLASVGNWGGELKVSPPPPEEARSRADPFRIGPTRACGDFAMVSPAPFMGRSTYGFGPLTVNGESWLNAHPDSDLWLRPPSDASVIVWEFGMFDASWSKEGPRTDGTVVSVTGVVPGGESRTLFERRLDPVHQREDRGLQRVDLPYKPRVGEVLRFSARPGSSFSYDWSYWRKIDVH